MDYNCGCFFFSDLIQCCCHGYQPAMLRTVAVLLHRLVLDLLAFRLKLCCVVIFFGLHSTCVDRPLVIQFYLLFMPLSGTNRRQTGSEVITMMFGF